MENKGTKTKYTGVTAEAAPNFCDTKYFISAEYIDYIGVGKMGKGSVSMQDCSWTIDPASTEDWRMDIYNLLVRSDIDGLPAREMATLVGYTLSGDLIGWDGETAWFCVFDDDAKAIYMNQTPEPKLLLIPYTSDGQGEMISVPCTGFSEAMMCGSTLAYIEEGTLHIYNTDNGEGRILSGEGQKVQYLNYLGKNGRHILAWVSPDGFHTLDLDFGNENYLEGDWLTGYFGLYMWNDRIFLLKTEGGFKSWQYAL